MPTTLWIMLNSLCIACALGAVVGCAVQARRQRALCNRLSESVAAVERDLGGLCGTQARVGDRLVEVEQQSRNLATSQTHLQMKVPAAESYRHAIELVERGASSRELMASCGLSRGEAELVHQLHAQAPSPGAGAEGDLFERA